MLSPLPAEDESEKMVGTNLTAEVTMFAHLFAFMREIYSLGPVYFYIEILMKAWSMINGALQLYFTSLILNSVRFLLC